MSRSGSSSKEADDFLKRSILSKIDKSELQALRIAVKRRNIVSAGGSQSPLERSIDDPAKIVPLVHIRNDCRKIRNPPIFGKGIKVNQEHWDDRQVFNKEPLKARSKSRSRSPRHSQRNKSRTRSRERLRSPPRYSQRNKSRTRSRERSKYRSRSREKEKYERKSKERRRDRGIFEPPSDDENHKPFCRQYKEKKRSRSRDRPKSKSPTPLRPGEYRPGHPDLALRYKKRSSRSPGNRSTSPRRSRSRSPRKFSSDRRSSEKFSSSKRRSRSPAKKYERLSPSRYKSGERRGSPSKSDKYSGRRSRTPSKYERRRSRSPPYKTSASSSSRDRRRSRSPHKKYYDRIREPPPDYGYYEGEYWMPGHAVRPGFPMPRFYPPPAFYPRGMMPGPMMMPRVIIHPYGPFPRQPLPVYNSGAVRPRHIRSETTATVVSEIAQSETTKQEGQEKGSEETAEKLVTLQKAGNGGENSQKPENVEKQDQTSNEKSD